MAYQALYENKNWEDLGEKRNTLLDHFSRHQAAELYHLEISSWHPKESIEHLIAELQKNGPLIVGGCFGALHYSVPPRKLGKQIEGRAVYGWIKTDPKNTNPVTGHSILLVGAEKTSTRELVYYIDPEDSSDPSDPEKQRIYCMSYERLTSAENICDYHGFKRNNAPHTIGYALYRKNPFSPTAMKKKEMTASIPRISELFEARKPKESAEITKIDNL